MSRIGRRPVEIPDKVKLSFNAGTLLVEGPLGKLTTSVPPGVDLKVDGKTATVDFTSKGRRDAGNRGLARALLANMVEGVTKGYDKKLEISGVGYKAEVKGTEVVLTLGYSHPVLLSIPAGIEVKVEKQTRVSVSGADKQLVGQIAAQIRSAKPVEPYKGKGVKYVDEQVIRKVGKTGAK